VRVAGETPKDYKFMLGGKKKPKKSQGLLNRSDTMTFAKNVRNG